MGVLIVVAGEAPVVVVARTLAETWTSEKER